MNWPFKRLLKEMHWLSLNITLNWKAKGEICHPKNVLTGLNVDTVGLPDDLGDVAVDEVVSVWHHGSYEDHATGRHNVEPKDRTHYFQCKYWSCTSPMHCTCTSIHFMHSANLFVSPPHNPLIHKPTILIFYFYEWRMFYWSFSFFKILTVSIVREAAIVIRQDCKK